VLRFMILSSLISFPLITDHSGFGKSNHSIPKILEKAKKERINAK